MLAALAICASYALGGVGFAGEKEATGPEKTGNAQELTAAPAEDLDLVQGVWTRTERTGLFGRQRITKEIKDQVEILTTYDSRGDVSNAHTVKIGLRRAGSDQGLHVQRPSLHCRTTRR